MSSRPPVVSVVGTSGSGKTTLVEKLVAELVRRGYRVGTIKHDVHGFEIDIPGKDTWRHAQAGARVVAISSPARFAIIEQVEREYTLDEVTEMIHGVALILAEGYKREDKPKIEVTAAGVQPVSTPAEGLVAVAAEDPATVKMSRAGGESAPVYSRNDVAGLCDLLEENFLRPARGPATPSRGGGRA